MKLIGKKSMMNMRRLFYTLFILGTTLSVLSSCKDSVVYDQYSHIPIAGWEKNDTLKFEIPPLENGGYYQEQLGLRITGAYPFMGLTLIVEQTIFHEGKNLEEKTEKVDTIQCDLIDKNGVTKGQGISYYQYDVPINIYRMNANDSILLSVRHDMKREILPGISDIGIKMTKHP